MHTITLVSQKGGTGKSTLANGLAIAAMQAGHKVCLLEADPQYEEIKKHIGGIKPGETKPVRPWC
jgi:cellulose biosynthesis protein BcsQ